ncbi:hypothetical protein Q8F55_003214 [Vanrija albida]|uniref:Uncharacterized protein n=1 Tax=Vanrija albida TaxID=181172 RepID=A0ABR3QCV1_9TREE
MSNVFKESNAQSTVNQEGGPQPSFLKKKGLLGAAGAKGLGGGISSPTDNVMSPISAKLNGAKQRHFSKGKPVHLASQLSSLAAQASPANSPAPAEKKAPRAEF